MSELRFDNKTVIITGAGGGLGRAYAVFFGSRGANVVVNDLGVSASGEGNNTKAADVVVDEIKKAGGRAVANYDSVEDGDKIVETAVKAFGTVHILINNAGILRDVSFKNMKDQDWDLIVQVHIRGSYKVNSLNPAASHPISVHELAGLYFGSRTGIYGSFGQVNYSTAKMSMVSFSNSLAKEGTKYNIISNTIVPIAASRMTETVMPPEILKNLKPEWVVPLVVLLTHENNKESGGVYELGAGFYSKLRYQRSAGALFKTDDSLTSSAILKQFSKVTDFSDPTYPTAVTDVDWVSMLEASKHLPKNEQGNNLNFSGKTVLVTGAGGGLGKAYALLFAKMGANVVVNDVMNPDGTVKEIKAAGGNAVGDKNSVEDGEAVIKTCLDAFGAIHVIINNAGILRDKSFNAITDQQWDDVLKVHLRGAYKVTRAAWPHFLRQKYGRVLNTSSAVGLYGNFGQTNYACAKSGLIGFTKALAREGAKYNILVNVIAPNAGTNMTATVWSEEMVQAFKPAYVAPLVCLLGHEMCPSTGNIFEVGGGWVARVRWQRSAGYGFPIDKTLHPEEVRAKWKEIVTFDNRATYPDSPQDSFSAILENVNNISGNTSTSGVEDVISKARKVKYDSIEYSYNDRDVILYNIGIGAKRTDLKWVFEGADQFEALPTFGVIPQFPSMVATPYDDFLQNFSPVSPNMHKQCQL
ncbi:Peroxisomal hydratase-dehydrogenase-epimerase [Neolecta irregularis DAH-3]|uniref:Peroxisomal hydratase-dehydrogenase-epimerase n=1 Tax=Neolecta irregularis (strain DAH-3) TaxID=1198029 RepID=A0A1U7LQL3_NEOID|nr:Peroxisomal hydratase-dehydrogenase-epimerase [Neolecta irregularis DAH-3]|eukprot:OLL24955.1 Peroxisomal hydratase-dehydrogenase-epimerase [Neolecta irregularis DAH-3]